MEEDLRAVQTADGRQLDVLATGPPGGLPLVFHHGTPGGLVPMPPLMTAAAARGLRVVLYSRPGYGGSAPPPGPGGGGGARGARAVPLVPGPGHSVSAG